MTFIMLPRLDLPPDYCIEFLKVRNAPAVSHMRPSCAYAIIP